MRAHDFLPEMNNILVVCTGNICRSPMGEGILRRLLGAGVAFTVSSAGTHAIEGNPATEFAVLAAGEKGIDISRHRASLLTVDRIRESRAILCMERPQVESVLSHDPSATKRVFNLADFSGRTKALSAIADPYGCSLREYRECFQDLTECLGHFLANEFRISLK